MQLVVAGFLYLTQISCGWAISIIRYLWIVKDQQNKTKIVVLPMVVFVVIRVMVDALTSRKLNVKNKVHSRFDGSSNLE